MSSGFLRSDFSFVELPRRLGKVIKNAFDVDADEDIASFDPFAPKKAPKNASKTLPRMSTVEVLNDFEDITHPEKQQQLDDLGTDQEADLLRSRTVIVKRSSSEDPAMASSPNERFITIKENDGRASPAFDVVDGSEVENPPMPAIGTRISQIFKARENIVRLQMAARENEFTEKFPFSIFVGTWNVNGQVAGECLKPWFRVQGIAEPPDIIAVGFQELDLSAEALVFNDSSREEAWLKALEKAVPSEAEYTQIRTHRLVGMMLAVFVQTKHQAHIIDVTSEHCGTGIMGKMGNKGAVAIRFQLHNSTISFVNSHLAAHLAEFERRNQDFKDISSKLQFSKFEPPMTINHHDIVIWLGDLNYRFDDLEVDQIKALIDENKMEELYKFDQLRKQMVAGKVFQGYTEGKLKFKPTYKFDPGTDDWDTSEKGRAPAWCDRILWRGRGIEIMKYASQPALKLSDHKPVCGVFKVGIKIVDKKKERQVFEDITLKLDRLENESLPQVKLARAEFHFDDVRFMEEQLQILPIANIGQVPAEFQFIPKLDDKDISKPWLRIQPRSGIIMPGDVQEIELTIAIDKEIVPTLNSQLKLEDILVLHLVNGKDFFVPINANYIPSVFGSPLLSLVKMYGPIKQIPSELLLRLNKGDVVEGPGIGTEPLPIPKELWLLVNHLYQNGMKQENILIQSGLDSEIVMIRNYLDNSERGTMPGSIFSVGEALLLFLESLPEPVIPFKFQNKCMDACQNYTLCKQVVGQMPDCHVSVFRYITAFLRELLTHSADNKLAAKILATVFGAILLRGPKEQATVSRRAESQIGQKKAKFLYHFLVNDFSE
ncbi:type II inositol 1,4,5-trisphosphate 5-phosphatase-like isoform X2 [Rhopilema esculentum]|uniref:type II inositol 1,4,5-trisphosphate 5-phosphatase-like isoform X2 n=1 Tax=Rhopilema esculentum TaxID=499914 RepID=UPI0031E1F188